MTCTRFLSLFSLCLGQEKDLTASIIALAKNLQLTVIAEGVETHEQWAFLHKQNCDQIQGFLISQPVSVEDVWVLLQKEKETTA